MVRPPNERGGDVQLRPPHDSTSRDEADLFQARRPLISSPGRIYGLIETIATLSLLGIFSFFGTLIRLGLIAIGSYNGQTVFPLLWPNVVGCTLMGMFTTRKHCIEEIYIPLYVGLTTGLNGSITSFSSWMGDIFQGFAQISTLPHGGFYNFMDGLGISIFTLTACIGAFIFGSQIGPVILDKRMMHAIARWVRLNRYGRFSPERRRALLERDKQWQAEHGGSSSTGRLNHENETQGNGHGHTQKGHHGIVQNDGKTISPYREHTILENELKANYPILVLLFLSLIFMSMWAATGIIAYYIPRWRGIIMFALILSPPGVWLRFYLSRLNLHNPKFPLGTFIANVFGTAILAMLLALQYTPGRSRLQCQILQGWGDGFCGTLTTVSTFIVEIRKLERKHAYTYVVISWIAGQAVMLLILGSVDFARGGLEKSKCSY